MPIKTFIESIDDFAKNAVEKFIKETIDQIHGVASSIVDPATGKHADVFTTRTKDTIKITTKGSPEFARELERRLGYDTGSISSTEMNDVETTPKLYFAHASEDHEMARPVAERMMAQGIQVWFDEWEIGIGDSLRRKMEQGLEECTHFLALLTPNSLGKPWVEAEIDAGFVRSVGGISRFVGVRVGIPVKDLSIYLRTIHCPEVDLTNEAEVDSLISKVHGVSNRPALGPVPKYVSSRPAGLQGWSQSALVVAEHIVRTSQNGLFLDPQTTPKDVSNATGLPIDDVRLGVMDLTDAGMVEETSELNSDRFYPKPALFIEFDGHYLDFNPKTDAVAIAHRLVSDSFQKIAAPELAALFPDWAPRQINSAFHYLHAAKLIDAFQGIGSHPFGFTQLTVTDRTRRFARENT